MKTISVIVKGKVQGVFFRKSTREKALELGIHGWVRNEPDESVKILASGPAPLMEEFIHWCRQGPSRAQVDDLEIMELPHQPFDSFEIIR